MASLYKTYLQREEYIYKKSTFQGFYKSILYLSPELTLTDPVPLSFPLPSLTVQSLLKCSSKMLRLGNRFTVPVLKTMCNYSHLHTMKEFWFFSFSSSLICCLKNSILCSRKVAWISHTRTRDLKFFNSVQISDMWTLPMLWASSRNLDACFSAWSAGHPWTCLMRFSLKCAASVGVNEHVGRADEFCGTTAAFDALLLEVWFGPGDGLLWLFERWRLRGETGSWPCCLSAVTGCCVADCETGPCLTTGVLTWNFKI